MGRHARASATRRGNKRFGDEQIDGDAVIVEPFAGLTGHKVAMKSGCRHRLLEQRLIADEPGVDDEIAVLRGRRDRHVGVPGVDVDRLRADEDDRVAVRV